METVEGMEVWDTWKEKWAGIGDLLVQDIFYKGNGVSESPWPWAEGSGVRAAPDERQASWERQRFQEQSWPVWPGRCWAWPSNVNFHLWANCTTIFFFLNHSCLQGALTGVLAGFAVSFWVGIGAQLYPPLPERTMPLSLETYGCNGTHNGTDWMPATDTPFSPSAFPGQNGERYRINLYNVIFLKNICHR